MPADAEPSPSSADATEPVILTEVTERIGVITLNRPARRNALNGELIGASTTPCGRWRTTPTSR